MRLRPQRNPREGRSDPLLLSKCKLRQSPDHATACVATVNAGRRRSRTCPKCGHWRRLVGAQDQARRQDDETIDHNGGASRRSAGLPWRWRRILLRAAPRSKAVDVEGVRGEAAGRGFPAADAPAGRPGRDRARHSRLWRQLRRLPWRRPLRGGDQGGPSLLRSLVALSDQHGELVAPIIHGSAPGQRHAPCFNLSDADSVAVAEYIHSVLAQVGRQARPPGNPDPAAISTHWWAVRRRRGLLQDRLRLLPFR